ncbi:MAG: hypothetical protein ACK504_05820 [Bacteroidota bacterium]
MEHFILMAEVKSLGSSAMGSIEKDLKNVTAVMNKIHKKHFITGFEVTDKLEFQAIISGLQAALEIIFDIEECLIENALDFKLKQVLYHHSFKVKRSWHSAHENLALAMIDARERLQSIKKTDSRFLIATNNEKRSLYLNNLFFIYEDYVDSWKKSDFEYVSAFLNNKNYKDVSKQFNINVSSGWRRERTLKMKQYYTVKEMILSS